MAGTKQTQRQSGFSGILRAAFGRRRQVGSLPWNSSNSWGIRKKKKGHITSSWASSLPNNYLSRILNPIRDIFGLGNFPQWSFTPSENDTTATDSDEDEMGHDDEICFGTLRGNIVGKQYYPGTVNDKEMVALQREPHNKYDCNAIRINNVDGIQLGYIKRDLAKPLAYICDNGLARIEGVVPCGATNMYSIPADLTFWGLPQNRQAVVEKLKEYGYFLTGEVSLSLEPIPGISQAAGLDYTWHNNRWTYLTQAEVKNELDKIFENIKEDDKNSITEPAEAIGSKLYPHQKQALNWMIQRENGNRLPPFWEECSGTYFNSITNRTINNRPKSVQGGILADDMGLGKTLEMIALILTNFEDNKPLAVRVPGTFRESKKTKLIQVFKKDAVKLGNHFSSDLCATAGSMSDIQLQDLKFRSNMDRPSQDSMPSNVVSNRSEIRRKSESPKRLCNEPPLKYIDVVEISSGESDSEETFDFPNPITGASDTYLEDELPDLPPIQQDEYMNGTYDDLLSSCTGIRGQYLEDEMQDHPIVKQDGYVNGKGKCGKSLGRTVIQGQPRTTLIVCPLSVISNWQNQLEEHVHESVHLNIYLYYGARRIRDNAILAKQDIVLTTYSTLSADHKKGDSPLEKVQWLRIVLDEGHEIRNPDAQRTKAILALDVQRKWILTGTPIQNCMKDLWSLVNFLQISPFTDQLWWHRTIERPLEQGDESAFKRIQHLMSHIALRRTKTQKLNDKPLVELPERKVYLQHITLYDGERAAYNAWHNYGKNIAIEWRQPVYHRLDLVLLEERILVVEYRRDRRSPLQSNILFWPQLQLDEWSEMPATVVKIGMSIHLDEGNTAIPKQCYLNQGTLLQNYGHILVILLRLRQLCCHPFLVAKATASIKETQDSCDTHGLQEKLVNTMVTVLSSGSDEECAICLDGLKSPVITDCAHVFCKTCIEAVIKNDRPAPVCSLCRGNIQIDKLWEMPPQSKEEDSRQQIQTGEWKSSTKVDALMNALLQLRSEDPTVKSIVVSQFTSFLTVLEIPLCANGFKFVRLDGSMNTKARTRAMEDFSDNSPGSPTIILLSLKAGGVGINLTAASRVFLLDPAWNPASEEQCFDRCHRLGQTKDVTIIKFIVEDSIETKMVELQEKKRQLMQRAFGQKQSAEEKRQARIRDIKSLMDL